MLPWLMERGEVPVAEMAARFELTEAELVGDLELAALCGLPPFIDEMIDVFIDEGVVFAGVPRLFTRPLRLTAPEGFALLIVGPGRDAAARRRPGRRRWPGRSASWPACSATTASSSTCRSHRRRPSWSRRPTTTPGCASRYWSASRDEATEREITPRSIFLDRGNWYVIADDSRSGESRTFRIDRFEQWERTGEIDAPAEGAGSNRATEW